MSKKYGIVRADQLAIAPVRGANFQSSSMHMPMKRVRPILSPSPGMTRAGEAHWGGLAQHVGNSLERAGGDYRKQKDRAKAQDRSDAVQQHPAQRSQSAVASAGGSRPIGSAAEASGSRTAPAAGDIYRPPTGMGAKVPASRAAKFAQGRGL